MSVRYFSDAEDLEWIIDGLVAKGCITVIVGESGTGKTTLALQLSAAMMAGRPFLGLRLDKGDVFWIEQDQSASMTKDIIQKMYSHSPELEGLAYHAEDFSPADYNWKEQSKLLITDLKERRSRMLILDAWEAMGLDNYNAMERTSEALKRIRLIAEAAGVGVLILHHFKKQQDNFQKQIDRVHGAKALVNSSDCILFLKDNGKKIELRPSRKFRGYRRFSALLMDFNPVTLEYTLFRAEHNPWEKEVEGNDDREQDPWGVS